MPDEGNSADTAGIVKLTSSRSAPHLSNRMKSITRKALVGFVFAVCLGFAGQATAQNPAATPPLVENDGQVKTFEVRLPVTVLLKKDLVSGLTKSDFQIYEDGVLQEITSFTTDKTNPPVFVGVLMDTSPSAAGKLRLPAPGQSARATLVLQESSHQVDSA